MLEQALVVRNMGDWRNSEPSKDVINAEAKVKVKVCCIAGTNELLSTVLTSPFPLILPTLVSRRRGYYGRFDTFAAYPTVH